MTKEQLGKLEVPDKPGVYFFLGVRKEVLYIGKATSLKSRVRSYFDAAIAEKRSVLIENMVLEAVSLEWTVTDSVLEAILLEANLIRTHKPAFNTKTKDDKSYNHVVFTKEDFPRILVVRGKDLVEHGDEYQKVYGPFPDSTLFKAALSVIRKIFRVYDSTAPSEAQKSKLHKGKLDFNRQIGLYPKETSKEEYARTIRHLMLFFEGRKERIMRELERDMNKAAREERFEDAHVLKKKILALQHIQDVALIRDDARAYKDGRSIRIEAYDVAHLAGKEMVGVMTVLDTDVPDKSSYRKFIIRTLPNADDPRALTEVLMRRFGHSEWPLPDLMVVDGNIIQARAAAAVLKTFDLHIPIVGVVKDEHHRPKRIIGPATQIKRHKQAILLANAEAHRFSIGFHRARRRKNALG